MTCKNAPKTSRCTKLAAHRRAGAGGDVATGVSSSFAGEGSSGLDELVFARWTGEEGNMLCVLIPGPSVRDLFCSSLFVTLYSPVRDLILGYQVRSRTEGPG